MVCTGCGQFMTSEARYCSSCGRLAAVPTTSALGQPQAEPRQLLRPREGRMVAGVCAGFAARYRWDPAIVRLIFLLAILFGVGMPVLVYFVAWIAMPNERYALPTSTGGLPGTLTQ